MAVLASVLALCSRGVLVYMVPFCLVGLSVNISVRTLFTVYPNYNMPVSINLSVSLPVLDLVSMEVSVIPSVFCTLNIWMQLSFVSVVLTFSMPFRASYKAFSEVNLCKKLNAIAMGVVALILESAIFYFVYQVYVLQSFSVLQLILYVPLLTFTFYSAFQGFILLLDCSHAFTRFHIALRIMFNCVNVQHGFCLIIISYYTPNTMSLLLSIIGLLYRIWVAIKYTDFLRMRSEPSPVHARPLSPHSGSTDWNDDNDGDVVVTRKRPGDHFYRDHDTEAFKPEESKEESAYAKFKSSIVVNVSLFYNYWRMLTHLQSVNLVLAFNLTVVYMAICYIFFIVTHYYSMFGNFYLFETATLVTGINVTLNVV